MKPSVLIPTMAALIRNRFPFLIIGEPAIGKTDTALQAAEMETEDQFVMHPTVSDPTDFKGMPCIVKEKAEHLPYGDLRLICEATKPTFVLIDDVGQATQAVQKALMHPVLKREINGQKISDLVTFGLATNRRKDNAGVTGIIQPLLSRFTTILKLEVDLEDWCDWAMKHNMPAELISFVRFRPDLLHDFDPKKVDSTGETLVNQPCPRSLEAVGNLQNTEEELLMKHEVIVGAIGEAFATEYKGFLALLKDLGDLPHRIANGKVKANGECPSEPSVLFALTGALAKWAGRSDKEWANISAWGMGFLPEEFQLRMLADVEKRHGGTIIETEAFIEWSLKANSYLKG